MRNAIGLVILLFALSHFFTASFEAFDRAATESFRTLEAAAVTTQLQLIEQRQ
jgi:hypothetical protein